MGTTKLTTEEKLLLYGLKLHKVSKEDAIAVMLSVEEKEDQLLLIHYMMTHEDASAQEIINEVGRIFEQKKNMLSEVPNEEEASN